MLISNPAERFVHACYFASENHEEGTAMKAHRRESRIGGAICAAFLLLSCGEFSFAQSGGGITVPATSMNRSAEVYVTNGHVTIYGNPSYKTYLYLNSLPLTRFNLHVTAAGQSGDNRWPKLGIAFNDTGRIVKEIDVNSTTFRSYDCGNFAVARGTTLYLVFTNDYHNSSNGADVNLKIQSAEFISIAPVDTVVVTKPQFTLAWDSNREPDLAGYRLYHGTQSGVYVSPQELHKDSTSYVFQGTSGFYYFFAVTAYDSANNQSDYSSELAVWVQPAPLTVSSDLNGDGKCDAADIQIISRAFGSTRNNSRYDSRADLNKDGKIDGLDQVLFTKNCK